MQGTPSSFWGKLEKDETGIVQRWHPLSAHCADVAACAEALLERTNLRRRLAALGERDDLDVVDIGRLSAIAALHDIGKFNRGFQRKANVDAQDTAGHVREVLALFQSGYADEERLMAALPVADLEAWSDEGGALELLVASIGHHGRPVRCGEVSPDPSLWKGGGARSPFEGIADLTRHVRTWFPHAFASSSSKLPDTAEFQHGFAGLVMLADWLGSDRDSFPFAESSADRMLLARPAARAVLAAIGLDVEEPRASLGKDVPNFDCISAFSPREAQSKTMNLSRPGQGGLTILESETGSGKTESALGRFVQLFQAGLVDGMVFALPTRSAATQLHGRVLEAMRRAFPDETTRPPVVLAVPGYLRVDDDYGHRRLPEFKVLWNDDPKERLRYRGWAAENSKRYLAGSVAVGTIDQVLLSSLRVGHAHLRATALLRQFLVVDEVHASDAYMNRILEAVLAFHVSAGGHAFLMSATLGSHVRKRLEGAAVGRASGFAARGSLRDALAVPYPVIHHTERAGLRTQLAVTGPGSPKTVRVTVESLADEPEAVAARALEAARTGARVLVLRNTVIDAVATQLALESLATDADKGLLFRVGSAITLHTARFAKSDRELLDRAIEDRFGKAAPAHGGVVAVATQTVQQSLDLDADTLFTDLAPMDVLLQRVGRVHRHRERDSVRPEGFEIAHVVVLTSEGPLEESIRAKTGEARGRHGVGTVYENLLILEATRRLLVEQGEFVIPAQNRELVEKTTHPEALDALAAELGEPWLTHQNSVWGTASAHIGLAGFNLVDRSERFGECSFRTTDLSERISARLGESDRRAVFAEAPRGPFGRRVRELILPGWLVREVPADPELVPTDVQEVGEEIRFSFGPVRFVYDRLGLRRDDPGVPDVMEDTADA